MLITLFCLILVLTLSHGLGDDAQFITEILRSWDLDHCDLGHVSDSEVTTISNELIAELHER